MGVLTERYYTCQRASGTADRRCQSTPETSQCHCASLTKKQGSVVLGQTKPPLCRRRWHSHTPLPSQISNRKRFPALFRNTNAIPEHGACPRASWTIIDKPSMPRRMSTGITASQICAGSPIKSDPATTSIATALIPSQAIPSGNPGRNVGQSF